MADLFYQQVKYLAELDEIQYENVFIDGTIIEANANRYTFVWKKVIKKNEEKTYPKIQAVIDEINQKEIKDFPLKKETLLEDLGKVLDWLKIEQEKREIVFVHGIGKRKTQNNRQKSYLHKLKESA